MDAAQFWSIIDGARALGEPVSKTIPRSLERLSPEDIASFASWFHAYICQVNREDLWAAVFAIRGGCSDDSFTYFCRWLVGRGESVVRAAIEDPESLAQLPSLGEDELLASAAARAYKKVAKAELPPTVRCVPPGSELWPEDRIHRGLAWTKDFYAKLYPRLYAKYVATRSGWEESGELDEAQFWALIDEARGDTRTVDEVPDRLRELLEQLPDATLVGFHRWLRAYVFTLCGRQDVSSACRVLLGTRGEVVGDFCSWLVVQGRAAVHAATHDLDRLLEHTQHPVAACTEALRVPWPILQGRDLNASRESSTIPGQAAWAPDWESPPTVAELRARLRRLTAPFTDTQLYGPNDVTQLPVAEREAMVPSLIRNAREGRDARVCLDQIEQAIRMSPPDDIDELLKVRGVVHARLGNLVAALADLDAVLSPRAFFHSLRWERSKVRLALGDRAGALADAREVAPHVDEARAWLITQAPKSASRVRHAKFGEGNVISTDASGAEPTFVIDFPIGRKTIASRFVEPLE